MYTLYTAMHRNSLVELLKITLITKFKIKIMIILIVAFTTYQYYI